MVLRNYNGAICLRFQLQCLQERLREGRAVVTKVQMKHRWLYYIPGTLVAELYKVLSDQNYDRTLEIVLMSFPLIADAKRHKETCNVSYYNKNQSCPYVGMYPLPYIFLVVTF